MTRGGSDILNSGRKKTKKVENSPLKVVQNDRDSKSSCRKPPSHVFEGLSTYWEMEKFLVEENSKRRTFKSGSKNLE